MSTIPIVTTYGETAKIPEGQYFVFNKGWQGTFESDDPRIKKVNPYLVCLKTGADSHRFKVIREAETSTEAREIIEGYLK